MLVGELMAKLGKLNMGMLDKLLVRNKNNNVKGKVRKGRWKYNFRLWEITGSYKEVERGVQPDYQSYPYSLFHSYLHLYSQ